MREPHFKCVIYKTYNNEKHTIDEKLFHNYESAVMYGEDSCNDLTCCFKKGAKYTYIVLPYKMTPQPQAYKDGLLALKDLLQKSLEVVQELLTHA